MTDLTIPKLVWISSKPLVKILLPNLVGAAMVKCNKLDQEGLKAAARIQIFGALPCLIFSNILPSINYQNASHILVCIVFGLFYMFMSYILSKVLLNFVSVPINFRNGFIVAAVWSNWGNIPISVIQSLAAEPPFKKSTDVDLGVTYASFFVTLSTILLFVGPGTRMIDQDYIQKRKPPPGQYHTFDTSFPQTRRSSVVDDSRPDSEQIETARIFRNDFATSGAEATGTRVEDLGLQSSLSRLLETLSPINLSLLLGTLIAMTPSLKSLFVRLEDESIDKPIISPDGKPILSIVLESTEYFGAAAIPLGLLVTGASFANLRIWKGSWSNLPLKAIIALTVIKLMILPTLGFLTVYLVDRFTEVFKVPDGRLLKLICLYYSCTVTSTNQISLSSIAAGIFSKSPDGEFESENDVDSNVNLLCSFIAVQYLIYPVVNIFFISLAFKMISQSS